MQIDSWLAFCSIAFIATVSPGPAILLVTTHSLQFGTTRSLITIAGNLTGLFTMSACSISGLSALVLYSATAFTTIKIAGALYLIYMGVTLWREGIRANNVGSPSQHKSNFWSLYSQGVLVSLTNPKAIVFTTALFPQFIILSKPLLPQFTILVVTFMTSSFICLFSYAMISQRAKACSWQLFPGKTMGKIFGSAFIGAGTLLATTSQR